MKENERKRKMSKEEKGKKIDQAIRKGINKLKGMDEEQQNCQKLTGVTQNEQKSFEKTCDQSNKGKKHKTEGNRIPR